MEKIKQFLKISSGSGSGSGYGYGDGYGSGYGYGYGSGYGSGDGDGSGYGSGDDDGSGDGSGYGYGDGYGSGSGDGSGLVTLNTQKVYYIDNVPTIIHSVRNNIAIGFIVNNDLTLTKTVVAKVGNYFAHGSTIKDAICDATVKYNNNLPIEQRIENFVNTFRYNHKYSVKILSEQHQVLTGSCSQGRLSFMQNKGIAVTDKFTIKEFIDITKNAYGSDVIKMLSIAYTKQEGS